MHIRTVGTVVTLVLATLAVGAAHLSAQQPLGLAAAERVADAAQAEAVRNGWNVTIVVADAEGVPILVRRMDGASARSWEFAAGKARTVVAAGMSTFDYIPELAAGTVTEIPDATAVGGGVPLRAGGEIVGAIAASGLPPEQDAVVAEAGAAAFMP